VGVGGRGKQQKKVGPQGHQWGQNDLVNVVG
jgi:hypothetical protein